MHNKKITTCLPNPTIFKTLRFFPWSKPSGFFNHPDGRRIRLWRPRAKNCKFLGSSRSVHRWPCGWKKPSRELTCNISPQKVDTVESMIFRSSRLVGYLIVSWRVDFFWGWYINKEKLGGWFPWAGAISNIERRFSPNLPPFGICFFAPFFNYPMILGEREWWPQGWCIFQRNHQRDRTFSKRQNHGEINFFAQDH